jgi:hypothetical protein
VVRFSRGLFAVAKRPRQGAPHADEPADAKISVQLYISSKITSSNFLSPRSNYEAHQMLRLVRRLRTTKHMHGIPCSWGQALQIRITMPCSRLATPTFMRSVRVHIHRGRLEMKFGKKKHLSLHFRGGSDLFLTFTCNPLRLIRAYRLHRIQRRARTSKIGKRFFERRDLQHSRHLRQSRSEADSERQVKQGIL